MLSHCTQSSSCLLHCRQLLQQRAPLSCFKWAELVTRRLTQAMIGLAQMPEVIERLRQEQRELIQQHGEDITSAPACCWLPSLLCPLNQRRNYRCARLRRADLCKAGCT